jgi:hypothetical protein
MGTWNYQLMKHQNDKDSSEYYAVHEYFNMDSSIGNGWTRDPITIDGENVEDIKTMLHNILADIDKYGVKKYE